MVPAAHPWLWEAAGSRWVKQSSITCQQSSFCLADSVLLPAAGSPLVAPPAPVTTCHSQQQATPSPRPWKKTVAGTLCKSKYLCSHCLPSPALYFLPFLKCHRSAVSIIVQEMSSLLAGSLTLTCAGCTVAALLTSAAGPCIHPGSSEDMARGEMGQSGTWPQSLLTAAAQRNPYSPVHGSDQDPGRPDTLFMLLQSKHPKQTNRASCLHTAASAIRKLRQISSLPLFLCSSDKASFTGDVAKRIIIYRRLLFPRGSLLNTQICICCLL